MADPRTDDHLGLPAARGTAGMPAEEEGEQACSLCSQPIEPQQAFVRATCNKCDTSDYHVWRVLGAALGAATLVPGV